MRFWRDRSGPATRTFRFELTDGTCVADMPARGLDQADLIGYLPPTEIGPLIFQLPLPLAGADFSRMLRYEIARSNRGIRESTVPASTNRQSSAWMPDNSVRA